MKQWIDNGDLGQITKVTAFNCHHGALGDWFKAKPATPGEDWNWMTSLKHSGVGAFGDLGTHALDILLWWLGEAKSVTAQIDTVTNRYGCDESGQGLIRFAGGATGTLTAGWVDLADPVKYLVSGTKGLAANISGKLFIARDGQPFDLTKPETDLPAAAPHAFELFLDAINGKKTDVPLVTAPEAAYRSAVMEAMYDGANAGTWVTPKK
ncbi:MAG: Gfo/Idh/MocA family oxidoreductase [Tepidisphaeraceae bacterium]